MHLRLTHKIVGLSALGVIGLTLIGAIFHWGLAEQARFRESAVQSREIKDRTIGLSVLLLEARRAEKDFLMRNQKTYIERHAQLAHAIEADLDILKQRTLSSGYDDLHEKLEQIDAAYRTYVQSFKTLAAAHIRLGLNENLGLEGELRASIHAIESIVEELDDPRLMAAILMMRRHEKDFIRRRDANDIQRMNASSKDFLRLLTKSSVPISVKKEIADRNFAYQSAFAAWTEGAGVVAQAQQAASDAYAKMESLKEIIESDAGRVSRESSASEERTSIRTARGIELSVLLTILTVSVLGFLLGRSVSKPLSAMTSAMLELARGNFEVMLPGRGRRDEIGDMSRAVDTFKIKAEAKARQDVEAQAEQERLRVAERRAVVLKIADEFETNIGGIVDSVSSASTELEATASSLTRTADMAQQSSKMVVCASEETSTNVQVVATASEELSASINEISQRVQNASVMAEKAVEQAHKTDAEMNELFHAAGRIGNVVKLITNIARQTNLLALNAAIEAAHAGDAGSGFTVVAHEVKSLAAQTAMATEQIDRLVAAIQSAAQVAVGANKEIGATIIQMSEIASGIAAAVEEQGVATTEIALNVQQAAKGTEQIAVSIAEVSQDASETGTASIQVLSSAESLASEGARLKLEVERFLATVRAA